MTSYRQASAEAETKTESRECDRHGKYTAELFFVLDRWIGGRCPVCDEESEREQQELRKRQESEKKEARISALMGRSGIPKRFEVRTLASYQAGSDSQKRVLKIAQRMAESDPEQGTSLVFCGKPGTGKTHLACGIALDWIQAGRPAYFMTVLAAIRSIKSTYSPASDRTEDDAIRALTEVDLLILDEIGVQLGTEHEKMLLFEIINERYQQMRPTILISNLTRDELTEYLGARVMDRFRESGAVVAFDWDSYRGSKQ